MSITLYAPDYASVPIVKCSPPSWMVEIVLREKGLAYERVALSFEKEEHRSAEMLARNPRGTIPVLTDEGVHVYETYAILDYLDQTYASPSLLPAVRSERARGLIRYHEAAALKAAGMALFGGLMRGASEAAIGESRRRFDAEVQIFELYAGAERWEEARLELSHVVVFSYLATAEWLGAVLPPALTSFVGSMRDRKSVKATWPKTWEGQGDRPLSM